MSRAAIVACFLTPAGALFGSYGQGAAGQGQGFAPGLEVQRWLAQYCW